MSADYTKACDHDNIERRPFARTWICTDCGGDVPEPGSVSAGLGPIKLDYATALGDARHLNWRRIPLDGRECRPCPADRPFYVACPLPTGDRWSVTRVGVGELVPWEATHWCDDLLGLPACSD